MLLFQCCQLFINICSMRYNEWILLFNILFYPTCLHFFSKFAHFLLFLLKLSLQLLNILLLFVTIHFCLCIQVQIIKQKLLQQSKPKLQIQQKQMMKMIGSITRMFGSSKLIINQYNFYVDFKGLLYFDDGTPFLYPNCIKDVKFITQFYKNLRSTQKRGYQYEAEFWGEKNYIRAAISPVIFNMLDHENNLRFSIDQKCQFQPQKLELDGQGRVWHPYRDQIKGVFSNDLIAGVLDQIQTKQGKSYYELKGKRYEIKHKQQ